MRLQKELPGQSHGSRSPSQTSSRYGSAFPDDSRPRSRSRLHSPSRCADEDHQEEQSSLDFISLVATLRSLNELPEASSESRKICGFHAELDDNN